jgi:hypothetical protein
MDPGTAAILTISSIIGISGYGAMKLNAKTKATIDEQVKLAIEDTQALLKSTEDAKVKALQALNKQNKEVEILTAEIAKLKAAEQTLKDEKVVLTQNLESATELEKTYRALSPEAFKQAITDFKDKPEIKKLEHPEFFEPLLSRFSMSRGTAQSLYTKFANAVTVMIPKKDFDELLLKTLKGADSSLAKVKDTAAAEAKRIKDEAAAAAKTKKDTAAAEAKRIKDEAATAAAEAKKKADADKAAKDARTLQEIVNQAFKAAKDGPLTSNTLYQKVKKPFLDGVDSVARGVQKAVDVTKQTAKKTGQVVLAPLRTYQKRQTDYNLAVKQQGGADTFDTDVYYRLFHPKEGDAPNEVLAKLFEKTSTDTTLARNILPVFDAFMYWRKTVLNSPLLYKIELVISAKNLFKLVEPIKVNPVFQNKALAKAKEAVEQGTTRLNPMTGRTFNAADVQAVKDAKVEPVKEFKEIIDEPPKEPALKLRTPVGGMRKKKLRTRRRDKQNVRRTRRSQNRPNRTDTYSSRRSEVDASGDELGL